MHRYACEAFHCDNLTVRVSDCGAVQPPEHVSLVRRVHRRSRRDPSTQPPVWGVNIDLGTSPTTNRTIPARSSREISFILSRDMLRAYEKAFPRVGPDPAGNFCKALYNGWVRIKIAVELWDYKQTNPKVVKLPEPSGEEPFWRGCDTITQGLFCLDPKNWE